MILTRFVGWLLALANSQPPVVHRQEFYALKDALCRRFGARDGQDVQRIVDDCWGEYGSGCGKSCRKCGGTGIYRKQLVMLERWKIGGRVFHRPAGNLYHDCLVTIEGRIRHRGVSQRAAREAVLWLALFFDRRFFRQLMFRGGRIHAWVFPLTALQIVCYEFRSATTNCGRHRCYDCDRRVWRPLTRSIAYICRRCERARSARWKRMQYMLDDPDLPF